ncbi:alpha/beta fold hydrolase [Streptomyces sp. B6B3]|uniref:thioesterase II family protein n=1 Tax=Streptomyces sp. B6B3 TaxID=3153570 RepID=UPI00325F37F9
MMSGTGPFRRFVSRPGSRVRLYCFPHAGGAASAFRDLAHALPETVEVTAVQYPGRQDRHGEPAPESVAELAEEIVAVMDAPFDRPTAFFGHSMGALVAFEAARRLRPRFPSPLHALFVSACEAPAERTPRGLSFGEDDVRSFLREIGGEGARAMERDEELWRIAYPAFAADLRLVETYRFAAGAPLTCPLIAVGGHEDASVSPADLARWQDYAIGGAEVQVLDGGHFYLDDSLPRLVTLLSDRLLPTERPPAGALVAGDEPSPAERP